jgi:hypothetical protein
MVLGRMFLAGGFVPRMFVAFMLAAFVLHPFMLAAFVLAPFMFATLVLQAFALAAFMLAPLMLAPLMLPSLTFLPFLACTPVSWIVGTMVRHTPLRRTSRRNRNHKAAWAATPDRPIRAWVVV